MAECSIHYVEQAWDNYDSSLDVWVNLTDLHQGKDRIESQDALIKVIKGSEYLKSKYRSDQENS